MRRRKQLEAAVNGASSVSLLESTPAPLLLSQDDTIAASLLFLCSPAPSLSAPLFISFPNSNHCNRSSSSVYIFFTPFCCSSCLSVCLSRHCLARLCVAPVLPQSRAKLPLRERMGQGGRCEGVGVVNPSPPPLIHDDRLHQCGSDPSGGSVLTFSCPAFDQLVARGGAICSSCVCVFSWMMVKKKLVCG